MLQGRIFHTDDERSRFRRVLDEGGLRDLFREKYPELKKFSWWDYRGGAFHRGLGLRIDFVLASPALAGQVAGAFIDRDKRKGKGASDHAPVIVDLE